MTMVFNDMSEAPKNYGARIIGVSAAGVEAKYTRGLYTWIRDGNGVMGSKPHQPVKWRPI